MDNNDKKQAVKTLTAHDFCDLQSVDEINRFAITKKFTQESKTYDEWYASLQLEYNIGAIKKEFTKQDK